MEWRLDTFWIQDTAGGTFDAPHRLARLSVLIEQALSGRLRLSTEIRRVSKILLGRRMQAIHVPPRVVIDNRASNTHTVLEVNGRDRPGLLHDVTAAISEQGLQIASAHVTTYGVRAVDVFYVKDVFGLKVENERKLRQLREALLVALNNPDDVTPPVTVPPIRKLKRAIRAIGSFYFGHHRDSDGAPGIRSTRSCSVSGSNSADAITGQRWTTAAPRRAIVSFRCSAHVRIWGAMPHGPYGSSCIASAGQVPPSRLGVGRHAGPGGRLRYRLAPVPRSRQGAGKGDADVRPSACAASI